MAFNFDNFKVDTEAAENASFGGKKVESGIYDVKILGLFTEVDKSQNPMITISLETKDGGHIRLFNNMLKPKWNKKDSNGKLLIVNGQTVEGGENINYQKIQAFLQLAELTGGVSEIDDKTNSKTEKRKSLNFTPNKFFKIAVYNEFDAYVNKDGQVKETEKLQMAGVFNLNGKTIGEEKVGAEAEQIKKMKMTDNYTSNWKNLIENKKEVEVDTKAEDTSGFGSYNTEESNGEDGADELPDWGSMNA